MGIRKIRFARRAALFATFIAFALALGATPTPALANAQTAPIGETIQWNNPATGNYGTVTPTRGGYAADGAYCREFQQTVTVGNRTQDAYGTACRQPDGSWKMVQG